VWQLYLMNTLVAAGFWMFWPTITALIQELTPEGQFVEANTFLLAGIQGGWLMAGAVVGFVYNHIGLGGVLLIDFTTYLASFLSSVIWAGVRAGMCCRAPPSCGPRSSPPRRRRSASGTNSGKGSNSCAIIPAWSCLA